jgi:Na+(H+)/acetate symporter ActP
VKTYIIDFLALCFFIAVAMFLPLLLVGVLYPNVSSFDAMATAYFWLAIASGSYMGIRRAK